MYIFVFYWSAAMVSAHRGPDIPFGVTFAAFMAAMMVGSLLFTYASASSSTSATRSCGGGGGGGAKENGRMARIARKVALAAGLSGISHTTLLTTSISLAAISLLLPLLFRSEALTLWSFCLFELCIGLYYPSMSALRASVVDDGVRAKIYGVLRIPLNAFVVCVLTMAREGRE